MVCCETTIINGFGLTPTNFTLVLELVFFYSRKIRELRKSGSGAGDAELREQLREALYNLDIAQKELEALRQILRDTHGTVFGAIADFDFFRINETEQAAGVPTIQDVFGNTTVGQEARHVNQSSDISDGFSQMMGNSSDLSEFVDSVESNLDSLLEFLDGDQANDEFPVHDALSQFIQTDDGDEVDEFDLGTHVQHEDLNETIIQDGSDDHESDDLDQFLE